jgi:hypothetical protein
MRICWIISFLNSVSGSNFFLYQPEKYDQVTCFVRDNLNYLYTFSEEKYIVDFVTLEEIEELLDSWLYYRAGR